MGRSSPRESSTRATAGDRSRGKRIARRRQAGRSLRRQLDRELCDVQPSKGIVYDDTSGRVLMDGRTEPAADMIAAVDGVGA
jgi:hypothetical protein